MPFQRPTLPYDNQSLPNSDRYTNLSGGGTPRPPTAAMLDADINYVIDTTNVLEQQIANIEAGILTGSENPANANLVPTTDGQGNISWIKVGQQQYENASITSQAIAPGAVLTNNIGAASVTGDKILNNTLTALQVANQTLTRTQMANQTLTNGQIAGAFFRANVAGGIINTIYNQNVASCTRTGNGVFSIILENVGAFTTSIPLGVNTFNNYNITQYLNKFQYTIRVYNFNGIGVDPDQLSFSFLYLL